MKKECAPKTGSLAGGFRSHTRPEGMAQDVLDFDICRSYSGFRSFFHRVSGRERTAALLVFGPPDEEL
ncbi:MAG: hypothetical protein FJ118_01025 [Deltaproteobacteria bacterium]|nr:hypothetical protein [Deltaproteobacteria bacterium]